MRHLNEIKHPIVMSKVLVVGGLILFAAMPPRVFLMVAPDWILTATLMIAIALPLLTFLLSVLYPKGSLDDAVKLTFERVNNMQEQILEVVTIGFAAVLVLALARIVGLWFGKHGLHGWLAHVVARSAAGLAGAIVGRAIYVLATRALPPQIMWGFVLSWINAIRRKLPWATNH